MSDKKPKSVAAEKKIKMVRDSFTMPKLEYAAIDTLKARALGMHLAAKKSELLRAGLLALNAMDDASLKMMLSAVPTLKTGRPKKAEPAPAPLATDTHQAAPATVPARTRARTAAPRTRRAPAAATPLVPAPPKKTPAKKAVRAPAAGKRTTARKTA
jgi:hypothetical protein